MHYFNLSARSQLTTVCFSLLLSLPLGAMALFDEGARYAFIASSAEKSVFVIDLQERRLAEQIKLDTKPDSVAASENLKALIVTHRAAKALTLIDLSRKELGQFYYPLSITPDFMAVSPIGETVAIYDKDKKVLEVHALRRKQVLLHRNNVQTEKDFTFSLDGSTLYWVDNVNGSFHSVDLWSVERVLPLTTHGAGLSSVSRSIDGLLGFVSDGEANKVTVINLRTFEKLTEVYVGASPGRPWGTTDGQLMLVPNRTGGSVTAISTSTLQVLYTVPLFSEAGSEPVSIHPGWLDTMAAVLTKSGTLVFIELASGHLTQTFELGGEASNALVTSDSKTLVIPVSVPVSAPDSPPASAPDSSPASRMASISFFDIRSSSVLGVVDHLPSDIGKATLAISNNLCH